MNASVSFFCRYLRLLLAAALLWLCGSGSAMAAIVINSITVNGGSTAAVAPGTPVTVVVTVTLTGGSRWRSTYFSTSPGSSINYCSVSPDISASGTWSVSFTVNAPATQNLFSLNVSADAQPSCNGNQGSDSLTLTGAINTAPATVTLNHVRILHDGSGLNCSPETVTLRACADASCASLFSSAVSVSLPAALGTWSANPVTFTGQTNVSLSRSSGGTAVLSGTVTSPTATNTSLVCYRNGVAGDCNLVFGENACQLDAVEVGAGPNSPLFTRRADAPVVVDVLTLINGVLTSNRAGDVSATIVDASSGTCSTTALSPTVVLRYNSSNLGRRTFTLQPSVAHPNARIRLVSGSLIQCSSDNLAIRPSSFTVSSTNASQDPSAASVSTASPLKAGSSLFNLAAASLNGYTGTPLLAPERVVAADVDTGVAGARGVLAGAFSGAAGGTASGNGFTYGEVGYFKLLSYGVYDDGSFAQVDAAKNECYDNANLGTRFAPADPNLVDASGRIGCYFGSAESAFFGRFVPDRFAIGPALTFTNRSALPACVAPGFTYMGEGMAASVPLLAQNAAGSTTFNYTGRFNRFAAGTQMDVGAINDAPAPGVRTPFPRCGAPPAHPCLLMGVISGSFVEGEATVDAPMTVLRPAVAAGPYEFFKIGIAPRDSDGVALAAYDIDTVNVTAGAATRKLIASTRIRHGRLNIDNAYGSELLNLTMRLSAQYWTGSAYATNVLDSCTVTAAVGAVPAPFTMTAYAGGITSTNMKPSHFMGAATLTAGVGRLVLAKPSPAPATKGSVLINSSIPYLPGKGRATFGLYKAGPVIYVRETY
ncbi:hypothetical protein KY495_21995 [Massilia sp. PAMC28688]|uniref:DUF6701 domain-containing protein n=1 Tax=Massilia sp. PAMC28688 TaxID=2861283 RepID=UPI001C62C108|nr:DUF6701 domain-containing protein [Massilia sp. PAMC28688]QYF93316.1 hypothetical protein KY495_21995 [Massilia sp. PAMC28688]